MPTVLLYHDVVEPGRESDSGFQGAGADHYKLTRGQFAAHLDAIAQGPPPLLTFDDGGLSALTPTADLLEAHGWRGWFFLSTGWLGRPGFLQPEQVRELRRRGHHVGSHSDTHPERLSACPRAVILDEWRRSRAVLEDLLGEAVTTASVPGGFYSRTVAETAAEAGLTTLFTSEPTSREWTVAGCRMLGRYTVVRHTSANEAVALGLGRWWPCRRQALLWQAKKAAKALGGRFYLRLRERALSRNFRSEVSK
jgi:peptidoglycan/xylan/chitin deacetylase (PgdA/CDA1 family)